MLKTICAQEDHEAAVEKSAAVAGKLFKMKLPKVAECIQESTGETLTCFEFPEEHHKRIRTNNPIERILREVK